MSGAGGCSGPTASKRLADHVNRDNSLHQDRLVGNNPGQSTGFRTANLNRDQGQSQFEAFQNQGPNLPDQQVPLLEPGFQSLQNQTIQNQNQMNQGHMNQGLMNQNRHAARVLPNNHVHLPTRPATTPAAGGAGWAAEFAALNARNQMPSQQAVQPVNPQLFQAHQHFGMMNRPNYPTFTPTTAQASTLRQGTSTGNYSPLYEPSNRGVDAETGAAIRNDADDDFAKEMDSWMRSNGTNGFTAGDMATVDAELEAVAREFGQEDAITNAPVEDPEAIMTEIANQQDAIREAEEITARITEQLNLADSEPGMALTDLGHSELGSLPRTEQDTSAAPINEQPPAYSDIAEAAGRLVDSVQHETGEKWTNSNFLKLMKEFRDGDKVVEDGTVKDAFKRGPQGKDDDAPQGGGTGTAV